MERKTMNSGRAQRTPARGPEAVETKPTRSSLRTRSDLRAGITACDDWEAPVV